MRGELNGFLAKQRVLVIAPHADDEVIGAGGLMARVKAAGGEVFVQVLSVGDLHHYDGGGEPISAGVRARELDAAMKQLGVDDYEILLEDSEVHLRLDRIPRRDLVNLFEREGRLAIDHIRPTAIVLPAPSFNQDHEAVYKAGLTACRPHLETLKPFQRIVLIADSPQLAWGTGALRPNFYVDITGFLEAKLDAFRCHASQQRPSPHQGAVDSLRLLAETRGREISVAAAEAFECLRFVV
ncbi:MAG: PIG-L family deacetylase [Planctomycetes bacterium]|nr:PIG-L family deacetylase [Planctomycetota bacterium]